MNSRLVLYISILLACAAVAVAAVRIKPAATARPPAAHASLPPHPSSYLGVYENGAPPSYQPIEEFAHAAGKQPNLVGVLQRLGEPFNTAFANLLHQHQVIPFVQIDPTFASVAGIAAGDDDTYLRHYAASVRSFGHPVVIGFGHEMNAPSYSWGYRHTPAATFVAAWRHIVTLFRAAGAENVTWLWTINADRPGTGPVEELVAGRELRHLGRHRRLLLPADRQLRQRLRHHHRPGPQASPSDPILLSETAVGPQADQYLKITDLFNGMASTTPWASSGSTRPRTTGSTIRTGAWRTARGRGRLPPRRGPG